MPKNLDLTPRLIGPQFCEINYAAPVSESVRLASLASLKGFPCTGVRNSCDKSPDSTSAPGKPTSHTPITILEDEPCLYMLGSGCGAPVLHSVARRRALANTISALVIAAVDS